MTDVSRIAGLSAVSLADSMSICRAVLRQSNLTADPLAATQWAQRAESPFLEAGEAGGAVGAIVARFPPVVHRVKELADLLAGSNAEPGDIMSGEREDRRDQLRARRGVR